MSSHGNLDLPSEIWTQIFDLAADEDLIFQYGLPTSMAESAWFKSVIEEWALRTPQEALNLIQRRSYSTKKASYICNDAVTHALNTTCRRSSRRAKNGDIWDPNSSSAHCFSTIQRNYSIYAVSWTHRPPLLLPLARLLAGGPGESISPVIMSRLIAAYPLPTWKTRSSPLSATVLTSRYS